jgi:hypothetical protein
MRTPPPLFYDPIDNDVLTGQLIIGRGHTFDPSVNPGGSCTETPSPAR